MTKVLDNLKTLRVGYQHVEASPTKYIKFDAKQTDVAPYKTPVYETTATFSVRQVGQSNSDLRFDQQDMFAQRAAKMVARELYGEVLEQLHDIQEILYQEGPRYNNEVLRLVNSLIDELELRS